jgi:transposase
MDKATIYELDIAMWAFQLRWIAPKNGKGQSGTVAREACGSTRWRTRKFKTLAHEALLLHARFARPFVQRITAKATDAW